jgi:hypothetical protein
MPIIIPAPEWAGWVLPGIVAIVYAAWGALALWQRLSN